MYKSSWGKLFQVLGNLRCIDIKHGKRKFAFTLAEVLITLGIIGVVAALTTPTLITNIEKQKNVTVLRRAYADITNFLLDFDTKNSCDKNLSLCAPNEKEFIHKFITYLINEQKFTKVSKRYIYANGFDGQYTSYLLATNNWTPENPNYGAVLIAPSGLYMLYVTVNQSDSGYYHVRGNTFRSWIYIYTDNGKFYKDCTNCSAQQQARATAGKNLFQLFIMNDEKIVPNGSNYCRSASYHCMSYKAHRTCEENYVHSPGTHNRDKWGCFARIIDDGWAIKYY